MSLFDRLLRAGAAKRSRQLHELVNQIGTLEPKLTDVTDEELRRMSDELRQRVSNGAELNEVEVEAFALVREAARRVIGLRHYDVQIYGGLVLARGMVAEMRTGEGKTLVATLPSYLHALTGKGVHVVTVNDYLASRDADWMGKIHRFLGLKVGLVVPGQSAAEKRTAYAADITYGTSNEFGFDYLRDNLAKSAAARMQRGRYFALVDEVDSVLIDEARTPLIISGPGSTDTDLCVRFADIAAALRRDEHYEVDETRRQVLINEDGVAKVEAILGVPNLYDNAQADYVSYLEAALRAKELFIRDVEYIVEGGEVKIVDEFTGRVLEGRRYSEGLHQAIEAKEKVKIQEEYHTLATVTIQNYFRSYEKLAGMTGTASTEDSELAQIYGLEVEQIPTNRPVIRVDHDDVVYTTAEAKWNAVIEDIVARHKKGQPVLVGTVSIEKSELVSKLLNKRGIPHQVLNAKHHAREAAIVAQAGRPGAVTVATNMAGRGVDILLGGNEEALAKAALEKQGLEEGSAEWEEAWPAELARQVEVVEADRERVKAAGGLYVLGTERHESRRIDNQLRGRSGRQGDPGESRFYLSFEDDVIRRFGGERFRALTSRLNFPEDLPIEAKMVTKSIERAQTSVEGMNFAARKRVLEYDEVTNTQRKVVYGWRDQVIDNPEAFSDLMDDWVDRVAREIIDTYADESGQLRGEDAARAATEFATWSGLDASFIAEGGDATQLGNRAADLAYGYWDERRETYPEFGSSVGAAVLLSVIDRRWQDQLTDLDHLRSSTGLRASAGQNPLSEFQREAYDAFEAMREQVRYDTTRTMLHLRATEELTAEDRPMQLRTSGGSEAASAAPKTVKKATKVGRNDPCPCGSGLKFKRCHLGREDELAA